MKNDKTNYLVNKKYLTFYENKITIKTHLCYKISFKNRKWHSNATTSDSWHQSTKCTEMFRSSSTRMSFKYDRSPSSDSVPSAQWPLCPILLTTYLLQIASNTVVIHVNATCFYDIILSINCLGEVLLSNLWIIDTLLCILSGLLPKM